MATTLLNRHSGPINSVRSINNVTEELT